MGGEVFCTSVKPEGEGDGDDNSWYGTTGEKLNSAADRDREKNQNPMSQTSSGLYHVTESQIPMDFGTASTIDCEPGSEKALVWSRLELREARELIFSSR